MSFDEYSVIGAQLAHELYRMKPTHLSWFGKCWGNGSVTTFHIFNTDRWKAQMGFLLRNVRIDLFVTNSSLHYDNTSNHPLCNCDSEQSTPGWHGCYGEWGPPGMFLLAWMAGRAWLQVSRIREGMSKWRQWERVSIGMLERDHNDDLPGHV